MSGFENPVPVQSRYNDALDQLFKTAAASLMTIANLLAAWVVFSLVFAIALTQRFSFTRFSLAGPALIGSNTTLYSQSLMTNSSAAIAPSVTTNPTPPFS